ncbi:thiamine pyrophosphate-binding protein [Candidatus Pelagibacter ubique]|jgi:acetolactate synthase I/II/III large subunit|nr:thiamine pyrophosphate-binding protein [Candidatus Pelagibacter ubique]
MTEKKNQTNVSDIIFKKLAEKGIDTCFMVTGGGAMFLNDALYRNNSIKKIFCHHEQACAMAADAYYRLSGKPAIVQVTTGPGSINILNGVFGAYADSISMIIIAGQVKTSDMTTINKKLKNLRQFGDQETNIISISKTITKKSLTIKKKEETFDIIENAYQSSITGRPGPVLIEVPLDIQSSKLKIKKNTNQRKIIKKEKLNYIDDKIIILSKKIKLSKRPIIIVGNGIRFSKSFELFKKVIKKLKIPILTVWNSHDLIENDNLYYAGRPGLDGERAGNFNIQNSDLLIIMGARMHIRQIGFNNKSFAREAFKVMIDIDEAEINKENLQIDLKIKCDLNDFLKKIIKIKDQDFYNPEHNKYLSWCKNNVKSFPVIQKKHFQFNKNHINPYAFIDSLFKNLKKESTIITGDGTAAVVTFKVAHLKKDQRLFTNKGCASMGYDLPAIIGAYFSKNIKNLICITGDGSVMMNLQELQTITGYKIPVKIFILNNEGYHSIRQTQHNYFNGREIGCGSSSGLTFPSFKKIANAFDFKYFKINNVLECNKQIKKIINYKKGLICEVKIDKKQLFEPRVVSYKDKNGKLQTPPLEEMSPKLNEKIFNETMIIKKWQK